MVIVLTDGSLARIWKSAMCSAITRQKGREVLVQLLQDPSFDRTTFLHIIPKMTRSC